MNVYDMSLNGYGEDNACFLTGVSNMDMQAYCAGWGGFGTLGNGSTVDVAIGSPTKFILPSGLTATSVEIQDANACVIANTGDAYCAGRSDRGQIAGTVVALPGGVSTPVRYNIPSTGNMAKRNVRRVLMQYHGPELNIFALTTDGIIWVSGGRSWGIFGNKNVSGNTGTGPAEIWGNGPTLEPGAQYATGGDLRASVSTGQCIDVSSGSLQNQ